MATQKDLDAINRQYPNGPDGPRIDEAIRFVRERPWGTGENKKPETAWPKRDYCEEDNRYLIRMVQELFVEIAQVKAMLEKPLYQINLPYADDTNDRSDDVPVNSSLKDTP